MIQQTSDVFILNDCVYWRYVWSDYTSGPGWIKETFQDKFFKFKYKENLREDITASEFREALELFNNVKDVPEFVDVLFGDALESIWLTKILYQSSIMTFGQ